MEKKNDEIRMLENEIQICKADTEQSIEAQMTELTEIDIVNQSKSLSADLKMDEQTRMLRKILKLTRIF